jgi:signal transduction histidine kinase
MMVAADQPCVASEAALEASERLARGQAEALALALDALSRESDPDRIVEHVLRTVTAQLAASSSSVWLKDEAADLMVFEFAMEDGKFKTKSEAAIAAVSPSLPVDAIPPWPEIFRTGKPSVLEDIREGPDFPWRAHVLAQGIITILVVPMIIAGNVQGVIGVRFTQKRRFHAGELELAQALANQAMLAIQLARLSAQSRQSAVVEERNRMARDIHDTLAQGFTGVIVQLEAAKGAAEAHDLAEALGRIERAGDLARSSLAEARRSVHALRPQALNTGTLAMALQDLLKRMTSGISLQTDFRVDGIPRAMPADWEDTLLRIAQESLTNTIKHARAGNFRMKIRFLPNSVALQLGDDGCGFEADAAHEGFGLIGMSERIVQLGGRFVLRTKPGEGTEILVTLGSALVTRPGSANADE